jgi:HEAT repeat protein
MLPFVILLLTVGVQQTNAGLESANARERLDAVETLSRPGRTENIDQLAAALKKEPRSDIRAAIVAGLARIGSERVVPILRESLQTDLDKDVRLQTIDAIQRLYIPIEDTGSIRTIFNKVKSAFSEADRPFVRDASVVDPAAKAALADSMQKDFSADVRAAAARALGSLRARDQIPAMIAALESPQSREHADVRLEIVQSLGAIRDPAAGPALEKAIRDPDGEISSAAILGVGLTAHKPARPLLENLFRTDTSRDRKRKAIEALALMADQGSQPLFVSVLDHADDYYREMAAEGLARMDHDPAVLKMRYDRESKPNVRNALAFGLAASNQVHYINDLALALDSRLAYQAEAYLFELGKFEGQLAELHRYLRNNNPKVRAGMARVVGNIGDPSSRQPIEALTKDSNPEVVREALTALRKLTAG